MSKCARREIRRGASVSSCNHVKSEVRWLWGNCPNRILPSCVSYHLDTLGCLRSFQILSISYNPSAKNIQKPSKQLSLMKSLKASLQQRHHLWQQTCRFRSQSFGTRPQAKPLATSLTFGRGTAPNSLLTLANRIRVPGSHHFSQNAQLCHCHLASSPYLYPILSISCMLFLYSVEIYRTLIKFADTTLPGVNTNINYSRVRLW